MRSHALRVLLYCVLVAAAVLFEVPSAVGQKIAESGQVSNDFFYVKKSTWQETMLASRVRLQKHIAEQKVLITGVELGPWYVSVPLKTEKFSDSMFGEQALDLEAKDADGKALWTKRLEYEDGKVHNLPELSTPSSTYLFRKITTARALSLVSGFGSNDGLEVWLNDKKLLSRDVRRAAAPDQDFLILNFKTGENTLLLRVFNRGSRTAFYFSPMSDPVGLLWEQMLRDFPIQSGRLRADLGAEGYIAWFRNDTSVELEQQMIAMALERRAEDDEGLRREFEQLSRQGVLGQDRRWLDLYIRAVEAGRKIDLSLLDAPLLFVKRHPYMAAHIYDDYLEYHPGGGIYIIDNPAEAFEKHRVRAVIDPDTPETLGVGVYRDPDISWDGKRVVFAFKGREQGDTSIYEIGINGRGLRRLTNPGIARCTHLHCASTGTVSSGATDHAEETHKCNHHSCPQEFPTRAIGTGRHDITPAYLPDGRIVFTSTRPAGRVPCFNSLVDVLHVMDADGKNIRCISVNNVNEFDPAVLPDGRILFGRWEYVDKTALYMQSLWTIFPDGTGETALFGNNLAKPTAILDARPVPNTHLIATALTPHNGQAVGAITVIDPHLGKNDLGAITNFTPVYPTEMDQGLKKGPSDPWPLSKDVILIANNAEERGSHGVIEMVDSAGNWQILHAEPDISCYSPMLVKPRPRPNSVSTHLKPDTTGKFFVQDIYRGLKGVERGEVKSLRVIEETARVSGIPGGGRWWNQAFLVSWQGAYTVKNVLGVVPVREDGSAYFEVPAGRALYFEALDEHGREIQRMRTFVQAAPGVTRSCVGCHENKMTVAPNSKRASAGLYPPTKPKLESWGSGFIDYPTMIQPILDKHCVSCHGGEKDIAGGIDLSGGWTWAFNISYETLIKNTLVGFLNCHNSSVNTARILLPRTHGSGAAPLTELLINGHNGRIDKLTRDQRDLILAWMDTNCNYYGTWNWTEHATCNEIFNVGSQLTQVMKEAGCIQCHSGKIGNDWVNLQNPQRSRILRAPLAKSENNLGLAWCRRREAREGITLVNQSHQPPDVFTRRKAPELNRQGQTIVSFASNADAHYQAMLDIIRRGRKLALAKPRVDMPGAIINPGICRQLVPVPLPEKMPELKAKLSTTGTVILSWQRCAESIGLLFELHQGNQKDFTPSKETLLATTTMFRFENKQPSTGSQHYALLAISGDRRTEPVRVTIEVPRLAAFNP
ncbi:MAG: HzsA-related protein [Planctomycetota bacterium]|jgi:hypothetical protein